MSKKEKGKILCPECRTGKRKPWWNWGVVVWPTAAKAQQSGTWIGVLKGAAKEGDSWREVRRTFKMLREVWLDIGVEKIDTHERVTVKALLDSGATGMFIDRKMVARHEFSCKS